MFAIRCVRFLCLSSPLACVLPMAGLAETQNSAPETDKPFSSMAIATYDPYECTAPRPQGDLAPTAYVRNGYRAILRILIAEEGLESETCDCLLDQFTWDMALKQLPSFQTSDNPRLPFKVLDLYAMADALEGERIGACEE